MSPSSDRFHQPSKYPLPNQPHADEQPSAALDSVTENSADSSSEPSKANPSSDAQELTSLVPKRPLMRPASRPQPPEPSTQIQPAVNLVSVQKPIAPASQAPAMTDATSSDAADAQATIRQQPIPPPSEPKQYRAIGLLRGRYTPSDEQFTRGSLVTSDGIGIEAVLLGRVMSLVRNHLDLEQEHLWVVYPRTREMTKDLHAQIVGVWEPEKLSKSEGESDETAPSVEIPIEEPTSPGYEDNYFSIRGEVVFHSPDEEQIVIKIQQAPRKSTDKEKAFKLRLEGVLPSPKVLGYFWDLQVERRDSSLVITSGSSVGLVPPRKKKDEGPSRDRRPPFRRVRDARPSSRDAKPIGSAVPTRRDPPPKPVKRTESSSD